MPFLSPGLVPSTCSVPFLRASVHPCGDALGISLRALLGTLDP